jgi:hypothetical protein
MDVDVQQNYLYMMKLYSEHVFSELNESTRICITQHQKIEDFMDYKPLRNIT